MDYRVYIANKLSSEHVTSGDIALPPNTEMGDYALPCFKLAKILRKSPVQIAEDFKNSFETDDVISEVSAVNGYLNFKINKSGFTQSVLKTVLKEVDRYGSADDGAGKTVLIDYSSVNIAKPFHIGHLSTTVIGSALYKIFKFLGYNVVGINHLGDYGTQFGKLISAYKRWGNREEVEKGGIHAVNELYVRFNEEADDDMQAEAREYFCHIENGEKEACELFEWFKSLTLAYVNKIYDRLNVHFDSYAGERFYTDKMQPVIDELKENNLLKQR